MGAIAGIVQAAQQQIDSQLASFQQAGDYRRQAKDLEYQASLAASNSNIIKYQGDIEGADQYLQDYKAMGKQAASLAQNGIIGSATGEGLADESEREAEKNQRRIRLQSDIASSSLLADSIGLRAQAQTMRRNARVSLFEGILGPGARAVTDPMKIVSAFN